MCLYNRYLNYNSSQFCVEMSVQYCIFNYSLHLLFKRFKKILNQTTVFSSLTAALWFILLQKVKTVFHSCLSCLEISLWTHNERKRTNIGSFLQMQTNMWSSRTVRTWQLLSVQSRVIDPGQTTEPEETFIIPWEGPTKVIWVNSSCWVHIQDGSCPSQKHELRLL